MTGPYRSDPVAIAHVPWHRRVLARLKCFFAGHWDEHEDAERMHWRCRDCGRVTLRSRHSAIAERVAELIAYPADFDRVVPPGKPASSAKPDDSFIAQLIEHERRKARRV
ncbi:MAG: hypothetical protein IT379_23705 [Deltaproteobacteria bacterium]|nr:hypothetical protein [Deltaproteobacteria bacterium]